MWNPELQLGGAPALDQYPSMPDTIWTTEKKKKKKKDSLYLNAFL